MKQWVWRRDRPSEDGDSAILECAVVSFVITAYFIGKLAVWTAVFTVTVVLHVAAGWAGDVSRGPADIAENYFTAMLVTLLLYREIARHLGWRD